MIKKINIYNSIKSVGLLFLLVLIVVNFISCGNNATDKEEPTIVDDSIETAKSIMTEDSTVIYENKAGVWINELLPGYNNTWSRFSLKEFWYEDTLQLTAFTAEKGFYKNYANFLRWSADSNYVLDIGTYGAVLVKDAKGNVTAKSGEADTEVSLLFPKTNNKYKIFFGGPGTIVLDGKWIDKDQFSILTSVDEKPSHAPDTILWLVDVKDKFFRKYELK